MNFLADISGFVYIHFLGNPSILDAWKNDECLECAYLPLCFGGCRFFNKLNTGSIDGVDCRRAMLDASLETIVRQDLKRGHQ